VTARQQVRDAGANGPTSGYAGRTLAPLDGLRETGKHGRMVVWPQCSESNARRLATSYTTAETPLSPCAQNSRLHVLMVLSKR
jgi:hypothetical protein